MVTEDQARRILQSMRRGRAPAGTDMELLNTVQSTSTGLVILTGLTFALLLDADTDGWLVVLMAAIVIYPLWMIGNCIAVKNLLISKGRFNLDG
ncbi:hypothetical protein DB345_02860 [Spartobacteria bacterium LR76]|nr:hypothetical protein DB345_02860 [Spartobacteria bacterium LR76]